MDIRKVKKLIEMLEESNLNEIEIKEGEEAVKLVKSNPVPSNFISSTPAIISEPTQQSPITKPSAPSSEVTVTQEISQTSDVLESGNKMNSPMVGTFYSAPNPESDPFVIGSIFGGPAGINFSFAINFIYESFIASFTLSD